MSHHDELFYIEGIKEHIAAIKGYLPADKQDYLADQMVQDAVLMRLLALGEEINNLSDEFKDAHPDLPWYKIVGLRNRLAHDYFVVDTDVVWDIVAGGALDELARVIDQTLTS